MLKMNLLLINKCNTMHKNMTQSNWKKTVLCAQSQRLNVFDSVPEDPYTRSALRHPLFVRLQGHRRCEWRPHSTLASCFRAACQLTCSMWGISVVEVQWRTWSHIYVWQFLSALSQHVCFFLLLRCPACCNDISNHTFIISSIIFKKL